jgi:hypothetical protein
MLCNNLTVFLDNTGKAGITINQVDNGSTDNCGITSKVLSRVQFNCGDIGGPQNVAFTATDASGNAAICTSIVTVKDAIAPTAVCQNVTVSLGPNGTVTVLSANLAATSFDNCSVTSYLPVAKTYTAANLGNNNLIITALDWSGNGSNCTSVVTVLPNGPSEKPQDEKLKLTVYPNPTDGLVTLEFILPEAQSYSLTAFDLTGMAVMYQKGFGVEGMNIVPAHLDNLAPGVYFLEVKAGQLKARKRLMVRN